MSEFVEARMGVANRGNRSVISHGEPPEAWLDPPLLQLLLRRILRTMIVGGSLLTLIMASIGHRRTAVLGAIGVSIVAGLLLAQRRGHTRGASVVASLGMLALAGYAMATANGLNDSAIVMLPGVFILTSILLGPRWLVLVTVLASLIAMGLVHAEIAGLVRWPTTRKADYGEGFEVLVLLWVIALIVHFLVSTLGQALADIRRAHDSAREILNATDEAILIHDPDTGDILDANESSLRMLGIQVENGERLGVDAVSGGEAPYDRAHALAHLKRAVTDGPQTFPWRAKRASGEPFWVEVSLRHATIATEPRILAVVRDVTERRALERRVQEAEKLTAVGRLAGGIAHDFNNQLVGIIGNADFLRSQLKPQERLHRSAEAILDSGERAAELTRQLLAFARRGRDRLVAFDVHGVIREVAQLVGRSVDKRISVEQSLLAEHPVVLGDPSALQNALLNLAINARDAMPNGGRLRFESTNIVVSEAERSARRLPPGEYLKILVVDTGVGMPPEVARQAFEPFFTTKDTGTGMGLAAVYGTLREHEGVVELESEPGQGTTFTLLLPTTDQEPRPTPPPSESTTASQQGRALVVDDEPGVAKVARDVLTAMGYDVDTSAGGIPALDRFEPERYDLVLLDITMPDIDGVEVLHRLRERDPDVRVLLMTGHASDAVRARLLEFPEVRVLAKPFTNDRLAAAVRRARE